MIENVCLTNYQQLVLVSCVIAEAIIMGLAGWFFGRADLKQKLKDLEMKG